MAAISILDTDTVQQIWAKVIAATGNGKVDVGYQCGDSLPYFRFSTAQTGAMDYYTTVHPEHAEGKTLNVPVYSIAEGKKNGITTNVFTLLGYGTQSGSVLTYSPNNNGITYEYQYRDYTNVRIFKINPHSKCKPIRATGDAKIDFSNLAGREVGGIFGMFLPSNMSQIYDSSPDVGAYAYLPTVPAGSSYPARLKDFHGYDKDAVQTLKGEVKHTHTFIKGHNLSVTISHPVTPTGSVDYDEVLVRLGSSVNIANRYPVIAIEADVIYNNNGQWTSSGKQWFISKLYSSLEDMTIAKIGSAVTTKVYADVDALERRIAGVYGGAPLSNNYRAIIWLMDDVSQIGTDWVSNMPSGAIALPAPPTNYVKWHDDLYNFAYKSSFFTYTRREGSVAGLYYYNYSVYLYFDKTGSTTDGWKYYFYYKRGSATEYTKVEITDFVGDVEVYFGWLNDTSLYNYISVEYRIVAQKVNKWGVVGDSLDLYKGSVNVYPA